MKIYLLLWICFLFQFCIMAYQPVEYDGLIGVLEAKVPAYKKKQPGIRYERLVDGSLSKVALIEGFQDFQHLVLAISEKPVVVLVQSAGDLDEKKMKLIVRDLADDFAHNVLFARMELSMTEDVAEDAKPENNEIMAQLMQQAGLVRLELPLILFFKNGHLYAPVHASSVALQGAQSKEKLDAFIKQKYFTPEQSILGKGLQDMTFSHRESLQRQGKKSLPSLSQRIANFFRRKK